jgi:carbamoyl-phosphate synthase small subunit
VVFNTAMTGYQEILTDPSYCRQIVTLTYPHIGNTGTNHDDLEAGAVYAAGLIVPRPARGVLELARRRVAGGLPAAGQGGRDCRHRHAQADAHPAREGRARRLHHDGEKAAATAAVHAARKFPG